MYLFKKIQINLVSKRTSFEYFCTKNCILDLETRDEINISYRHDNVMVGIFVR